jgi:hypothetical protein
MKEQLKQYWNEKAKPFLKRYNELWLGPVAIVLFIISEAFVRDLDPQAVPYTMDAFQKIIFGHAVFAISTFSALLAIRLAFPNLFYTLVDDLPLHFNQLNPWQKLKLSFSAFACYLLALVLAMTVL